MGKHYIYETFHLGGFFSNFNMVIGHLAHNKASQITWNMVGLSHGPFSYNCGEVFSKLFENIISEDEIHEVEKISRHSSSDYKYTGINGHNLYINEDQSWRHLLNSAYKKYIHPTDKLKKYMDEVDNEFNEIDNLKIGILKRNYHLKDEQKNGKMPTFEDYIEKLNCFEDFTCVLSVDDKVSLHKFQSLYDCIFCENIPRSLNDTDNEIHLGRRCSEEDAFNFFLEVYRLSKCDYFIHPISNMSTAVLYMNPEIKSIYLC